MSHCSLKTGRLATLALMAALLGLARPAMAQRQHGLPDFRTLALSQQARPFAGYSLSALTLRDSLVALARAQVGKRYRLGGTTPDRGFDCSGLVKYVLGRFRVSVPRTSLAQAHAGSPLPRDRSQLRPGDLLLFGRPRDGVSHVGIYVGNGRFIHASSTAGRVIESPLDRPASPLIKSLKSARRVLDTDQKFSLLALRGQ